ncbi:MAG: hypothetical protein ACI9X4_001568 [Glaciecola sp.]|jgi:hypothetical protein
MKICVLVGSLMLAVAVFHPPLWGAVQLDDGRVQTARVVETPKEFDDAIKRLESNPNILSLQAAFQSLARVYPQRVRLENYGTSKEGRSLFRLRVLPWDVDLECAKAGQPTVLVVAGLQSAAAPGPLLRWVAMLAMETERSQGPELIFYPMPDPDRWAQGRDPIVEPSTVCLARNFPDGWSPWLEGFGNPGSLPLSEPETRSLAKSMAALPEAVALILLGTEDDMSQGKPAAGTLGRYARESLGLLIAEPSGTHAKDWTETLRWVDSQRPRIQVQAIASKRLSKDLWMVDLAVSNSGQQSAGKRSRGVEIQVTGASCLKVAWAPEQVQDFTQLENSILPVLPRPGGHARIRLVLRVTDAQAIAVHLNSPGLHAEWIPLVLGVAGEAVAEVR